MTRLVRSSLLIWIIAFWGCLSPVWNRWFRRHALFAGGFLFFSFLATSPGLYFRPHYFVLLLPAVALLAGIGASALYEVVTSRSTSRLLRALPVVMIIGILSHAVWQQRDFFFMMSPNEASRATYGLNPFPESLEIARYIRGHSSPGERIAVIGSEPQIYFYSNRRAATGYVYTYALMEEHQYALEMQREMQREIEHNSPEFLIFVNISTSWLVRPGSEKMIFQWAGQYAWMHYEPVGVVDIRFDGTVYRWDDEAASYSPDSPYWIKIFRRKKTPSAFSSFCRRGEGKERPSLGLLCRGVAGHA